MGYSDAQLRDLEATINATECDFVVAGTPISLDRIIDSRHPIRHVTYELRQVEGWSLTSSWRRSSPGREAEERRREPEPPPASAAAALARVPSPARASGTTRS